MNLNEKVYVGIDPGKDGGICLLSADGELIKLHLIPTIKDGVVDPVGLRQVFETFPGNCHVVLEQVHAIWGAAAGSTFEFGHVAGLLEGLIIGFSLSYTKVQPKIWQRELLKNIPLLRKPGKTTTDTKSMALLAARRLFPKLDFTPTERSRKPHDGLVDATLLAEYGRRLNL